MTNGTLRRLYSLDAQQHAIEKWMRVKGGKVDAVVVHRFDRFACNTVDALAIKSLFRRDCDRTIRR